MRSFATVPPTLWLTAIKKLRGDTNAIAVYFHLTTSPHSTMIGIYALSLDYLAIDLGIPLEEALKGLRRVIGAGLCTYDEGNEIVWVHEMAASQVASRLSPKDNKVTAVAKQLVLLPICPITLHFYRNFREAFHLSDQLCLEEYERAFKGALDPLRSKEKDKEQEKDLGKGKLGSEGKELGTGHVQDDELEHPYDNPATVEEGRLFLVRNGVPPNRIEEGLQRLMRGALYPCDIDDWQLESREIRGAA